ncbi:ATP-binding protein [Acrocarpospora macrocephala]|uniref:ATP-binding protein n=1 Tax=Acrocarpospora macrocephala TaxID=150177 RepID=UPI0012D36FF5|nr:LuxR C-terminal-related transcriptional regulator [Acrocarpospora macrocephala]
MGNLPLEPNAFVGREPDVAELVQLITATRVVTLSGMGGIGKSRLALRVAAELAGDLPDGAWLVEFPEGTPPDEVVRRTATILRVEGEPRRSLRDTVAEVLAGRRMLLLLDNCETVVEECARLVRRLTEACPEVRVLATSREPLRVPGETVWRVPPLMLPASPEPADVCDSEAGRLFLTRAAAAAPGFALTEANAAVVARLCRDLDGLPLALELAAGMTRVLSMPQLVSRLGDRFHLLAAGDRTAPPRQRTLRATVDWSYRLLSDPERLLLRRATAFRAGWTLDMAERICSGDGLPPHDVLAHLTALVDKSLVVVDGELAGEARYRLLDTIRQYATEQLDAAGEEQDVRRRHRDYFCHLGRDWETATLGVPWPDLKRRVDRLERLQGDLRGAVEWSAAAGDTDPMLQALVEMRWALIGAGRYQTKMISWLDRLLALASPELPAATRGRALLLAANLAVNSGDLAGARSRASRGVELCRSGGHRGGEALGLMVLAVTDQDDPDAPEKRLDQAVTIGVEIGERLLEAEAHGFRAFLALGQGRIREAQRASERVVELTTALDNHLGMVIGLTGLAQAARKRGDLAAARRHFTRAMELLRGFDARQSLISCLAGLGTVALESGDLAEARRRFDEALRLGRDAGLRMETARRLAGFALLSAREGDPRRAVLLAAASSAQRRSAGSRLENVLAPARDVLGEATVAALWAEGLGLTLDQAVRLALEEAMPAARPVVQPAALTPQSTLTAREQEIAELIARGLSNRAIADELVISQATVARHVANILAKLGFASRTQVATWVVEHARPDV